MAGHPGEIDLTGVEPGSEFGLGPEAARPQPADAPGDRSGGWRKVGDGYEGGRQFDYANGYYGIDGPAPWRQS